MTLLVGGDTVVFGMSIPSDSVVTSQRGFVHFIGEEINWQKAALYALDGYLMNVTDPDTPKPYDQMWDRFVPKAVGWAQAGMDLDTNTQNTVSFYEPGEATVEDIMDLGELPERVFMHRGFRTVVNNPMGYNFVASDASTYFPVAEVPINVKRQYRVGQQESVLLYGAGSPLLTDVTVTQKSTLGEEVWAYMKYAGSFLEDAFLSLIGDIEVGAESPYIQILDGIEEELLPAIIEAVAGDFDDMVYQLFGQLNAQVTVVGDIDISSLSLKS